MDATFHMTEAVYFFVALALIIVALWGTRK
jgi:hypothetical protein